MTTPMIDISALRAALLAGTNTDDYSRTMLVPKDMAVVDLEQYHDRPARHRGTYSTSRLADFMSYISNVNGERPPDVEICAFTNSETGAVTAILDFGSPKDPQWQDHTAVYCPRPSPMFMALTAVLDRPLSQDLLLDFFDDWAPHLSFSSPGAALMPHDAVRAMIADLTLETLRTLKTKVTDFERQRSAAEKLTMQRGLPNRMIVTCSPWDGLIARDLQVRIQAADAGSTPALKLSLIGWEITRQAMIDEIINTIARDSDALVRIGSWVRHTN